MIKLANQSPVVPLGQIWDCKISIGGEEDVVIFYVIRMHFTKDLFPMLLGIPWLQMANAVVNWNSLNPSITNGLEGNQTKVPIRSIRSVEIESTSSSYCEEEASEDGGARGKLVGAAQLGKGKSVMAIGNLGSLGPSLYH